jgi:hypothetical protein
MIFLQSASQFSHLPLNINIQLIDESGKRLDPKEVKSLEYLSRFQNKCVVNKVCRDMIADRKTGTIEVYQDKIVVREF